MRQFVPASIVSLVVVHIGPGRLPPIMTALNVEIHPLNMTPKVTGPPPRTLAEIEAAMSAGPVDCGVGRHSTTAYGCASNLFALR